MKNLIKSDGYRVLGSFVPWLAIFLFALSRLSVAMPEFIGIARQSLESAKKVGFLYYSSFFLSAPVNVFAVSIACLPYGLAYLEDRRSDFDRYFIARTNIFKYSLSKYLVNLFTSIVVALTGFFLTIGIFVILCQGNKGSIMQGDGSVILVNISQSSPALYIVLLSGFTALYCGFWSSFVLLVSSYLDNPYIIFSLTYAGVVVTSSLRLYKLAWPMFSNLAMKGAWLAVDGVSFIGAIVLNLLQYFILYFILFVLFLQRVKKNYERK